MQINFFTFRPVQQTVELSLYTEKHPDTHPELVYADECPELWQQHSELTGGKSLFYSLTNPAECKGTQYTVQIVLNNQKHTLHLPTLPVVCQMYPPPSILPYNL